MINLLFFAGSSLDTSLNSRLVRASADLTRRNYGDIARVALIDLSDYDLPNFPGTQDSPPELPKTAAALHERLAKAQGIFIGSDEYTGTYSTKFRNIVRWMSVAPAPGGRVFSGKPVALCGATPRGIGSLRGQPALRQFLQTIGAKVISQNIVLGTATSAFGENGTLLPRVENQLLDGVIGKLVQQAKDADD